MGKNNLHACIVDSITGTVLDGSGLYYCEASDKRIEEARESDSSAHDLAMRRQGSVHISPELMDALLHNDVEQIGELLGWGVETDNDGQIVLYTDVKYTGGQNEKGRS
jgi:hypothetical protein